MAKRKPASPHRSEAHEILAVREMALYELYKDRGTDAYLQALRADRVARWTALLEGREESGGIRQWAADMAIQHMDIQRGVDRQAEPTVWVHNTRLPWIMALYVVKYGEAEDFWPEGLSDDDLARARRWQTGDMPEGVRYVRGE